MLKALGTSNVSVPVLVLLCLTSFFVGRFLRDSEFLPDLRTSSVQKDVASANPPKEDTQATADATPSFIAKANEDASIKAAAAAGDPEEEFLFELREDDPTYPGPKEFQQLLDVMGLTKDYPPVPHGDSGEGKYHAIPFQVLSWHPRILLLPNFLSAAQVEEVLGQAQAEVDQIENEGDDSDGYPLGPFWGSGGDAVDSIIKRAIAFTRMPPENGEGVGVFRFKGGSKEGLPPNWQTFKNHMVNIQVFLSEHSEGGETVFPYEGVDGLKNKLADGEDPCKTGKGYRIPARLGDALIVWRENYKNELDLRSDHWTCPTPDGEDKWIATMRMFEVPDKDPDGDPAGAPDV